MEKLMAILQPRVSDHKAFLGHLARDHLLIHVSVYCNEHVYEPGRVLGTGVHSNGGFSLGLRATESSTGMGTGKQATAI